MYTSGICRCCRAFVSRLLGPLVLLSLSSKRECSCRIPLLSCWFPCPRWMSSTICSQLCGLITSSDVLVRGLICAVANGEGQKSRSIYNRFDCYVSGTHHAVCICAMHVALRMGSECRCSVLIWPGAGCPNILYAKRWWSKGTRMRKYGSGDLLRTPWKRAPLIHQLQTKSHELEKHSLRNLAV